MSRRHAAAGHPAVRAGVPADLDRRAAAASGPPSRGSRCSSSPSPRWGRRCSARALGLGRPAALLAGVSFAFGTYMVDWLDASPRRRVPDAAVAAAGAASGWPGAAGCATGPLLAGCERADLAGRPAAERAADAPRRGRVGGCCRVRGRPAARCSRPAPGLAGLAMAAMMLVPLAEALGHALETSRAQPPMSLRAAFTLFLPEHWGSPDGAEAVGPEQLHRAHALRRRAAAAAGRGGPGRAAAGRARSGSSPGSPWSAWPCRGTPGRSRAVGRRPARAVEHQHHPGARAGAFAVAMLAGFGLQRLLDGDAADAPPHADRGRRGGGAAGARRDRGAALPAGAARRRGRAGWSTATARRGRACSPPRPCCGGRCSALLARRRRRLASRGVRSAAWAACALVAVDLLAVNAGYNPAIPRDRAQPPRRRRCARCSRRPRRAGASSASQGLQPNTASRWGLRDARGREQPTVRRTIDLQRALGDWLILTGANEPLGAHAARLLDVYGVRAFLVASPQLVPQRPPRSSTRARTGRSSRTATALPDAWVAYCWRARDRRGGRSRAGRRPPPPRGRRQPGDRDGDATPRAAAAPPPRRRARSPARTRR